MTVHNVALLGCAHIHIHDAAAVISAREDVRCGLVWDHDADRAARWASELWARAVKYMEEVLGDPAVTAVIMMGETGQHPLLIAGAADAGNHMYMEKPLCTNHREAANASERLGGSGLNIIVSVSATNKSAAVIRLSSKLGSVKSISSKKVRLKGAAGLGIKL